MKYKWIIDIVLKSGYKLKVEYEGPEDLDVDVANKLFFGKSSASLIDFCCTSNCSQHVFVTAGEIAAFGISASR